MKKSEQYQYQNSKAMSFLDNMEIFKGDLDREKIEDIKKLASTVHQEASLFVNNPHYDLNFLNFAYNLGVFATELFRVALQDLEPEVWNIDGMKERYCEDINTTVKIGIDALPCE